MEMELKGQAKDNYSAFYDSHPPTRWEPVTSSRGVPQLPLPVLIPCVDSKADGRIYHHALDPLRIAELPVRQLNPHELLRADSPLWQEHLQDVVKLVGAIESDKGVAKVIHEQLAEASNEQERQAQQHPWSYAAALLNSGLFHSTTQLVVWWRDRARKLEIGIYCPNVRAAAHALVLGRGTKLTLQVGCCQHCGREFLQDAWHPHRHCTDKCRNAAAVAAFRKRSATRTKRGKKGRKR